MSFLELKQVQITPTFTQVVKRGLQVPTTKDSNFKELKMPPKVLSEISSYSFSKNDKEDYKIVHRFACQQCCTIESSDKESDINFDVPPILSKIGSHIVTM